MFYKVFSCWNEWMSYHCEIAIPVLAYWCERRHRLVQRSKSKIKTSFELRYRNVNLSSWEIWSSVSNTASQTQKNSSAGENYDGSRVTQDPTSKTSFRRWDKHVAILIIGAPPRVKLAFSLEIAMKCSTAAIFKNRALKNLQTYFTHLMTNDKCCHWLNQIA